MQPQGGGRTVYPNLHPVTEPFLGTTAPAIPQERCLQELDATPNFAFLEEPLEESQDTSLDQFGL